MLPPAPATFSSTTGWPSSARIRSATTRPTVSVGPPAMALLEHVGDRQHLDVELINLAGRERLRIGVGVERPLGLGALLILLAVRGLQPALRHRREARLIALLPRRVVLRMLVRQLDDELGVDRGR